MLGPIWCRNRCRNYFRFYVHRFNQQVIDTTLGEFDRNRAIQEQTLADAAREAKMQGVLGAGRARCTTC